MKFKLIIVMVADGQADRVTEIARSAGATGCTVIPGARGEGLKPPSTFLGLTLEGRRDVVLLLVEEHLCRYVLETVAREGRFEEEPGAGIAFQVDIEDAIGLSSQFGRIGEEIEDEI